jgi:hypothetical protein
MLLLFASERAELMRLAKPELAPVVSRGSTDLYEALGDVRRAVKRLWRATSKGEILHIAGEEARQLLPHAELIWVQRGNLVAREELVFPKPREEPAARLARARDEVLRRLTREQFARLAALLRRIPVGEMLPFEAFPLDIVQLVKVAMRERGLAGTPLWLAIAPIRGSSGSRASLGGASTRPHDVGELEPAMLSTIAGFASLALQ